MKKNVLLTILDGWGLGKPDKYNAIDNANTPNIDKLTKQYLNGKLYSHGKYVGLPNNNPGTSETNHITIGTGKIIKQPLSIINESIKSKKFFTNEVLINLISTSNTQKSDIHLAGILSDGGVHSHIDHLFAILETLRINKFKNTAYIHIFTDGRDTPPISAESYLSKLQLYVNKYSFVKIATLQGRTFLDRSNNLDKTVTAFNLIFNNEGEFYQSWDKALQESYKLLKNNKNDQFHKQYTFLQDSDTRRVENFVLYNFRADRIMQLLTYIEKQQKDTASYTMFSPNNDLNVIPIFNSDNHLTSLSDIISENNLTQYHIAESEKFKHVTYYINGKDESPNMEETWQQITSNKTISPHYHLEPSMRCYDITQRIIDKIEENETNFIVSNYAQTDMVGHTGKYEAAVVAAEATDYCIGLLYEKLSINLDEWVWIITADHGNSEEMWDYQNNQPHTQHTLNQVPIIIVASSTDKQGSIAYTGELTQIAPTILNALGIKHPDFKGRRSFLE